MSQTVAYNMDCMSGTVTYIACRNCGAPLRGYKCEYCDSVYLPLDVPHIITRELTPEEAQALERAKNAPIMLAPRERMSVKLWNGEIVEVI